MPLTSIAEISAPICSFIGKFFPWAQTKDAAREVELIAQVSILSAHWREKA
jgi:hypothetical protein